MNNKDFVALYVFLYPHLLFLCFELFMISFLRFLFTKVVFFLLIYFCFLGANLSKTSRETLKSLSNPASFLLIEILESSFFRTYLELTLEKKSLYTKWKVCKCGVFSGPYFPVFGLNADIYSVRIIQSEYGKIRAKKLLDK